MKNFFLLFCSIIILFQAGTKTFLVSNYLINSKVIAEKFCENKTNLALNCKGKCHLKKQLVKQEKSQKPLAESYKEINEYQLVSLVLSYDFQVFYQIIDSNPFSYFFKKELKWVKSFFHPPC